VEVGLQHCLDNGQTSPVTPGQDARRTQNSHTGGVEQMRETNNDPTNMIARRAVQAKQKKVTPQETPKIDKAQR
jgi:hypothetical protein